MHGRSGAAPPRVKLLFDKHADLRDQLRAWSAHQAAQLMALSHADLLSHWPQFKRRLAAYCGALNAQARRRAPLQERIDAEIALNAARAALTAGSLTSAAVPSVAELQERVQALVTAQAAWRRVPVSTRPRGAHPSDAVHGAPEIN